MRVVLITGSYPPDVCGTADYTARLQESLQRGGVDARIFYRKQWGVSQVPRLLNEINSLEPDLIHMQYPTTGYGWKLAPHLIGMIKPVIITLHEASQAHFLRQISLYPFFMRARHFIFTNQFEEKFVKRMVPWIRDRTSVIPIGCNISLSTPKKNKSTSIICFSIIRPNKGLEDVIELARTLQERGSSIRVCIVGSIMPRWTSYAAKLRDVSAGLPVDWMTDLDDHSLSQVLAEAVLAYLPYPDGASERRSSLIAMLANGVQVMTTCGVQTPEDMKSELVIVDSPRDAAERAIEILSNPETPGPHERIANYARRFSWDSISLQHIQLYEKLREQK